MRTIEEIKEKMSMKQMVDTYQILTGKEVKRFRTKLEGATKLFEANKKQLEKRKLQLPSITIVEGAKTGRFISEKSNMKEVEKNKSDKKLLGLPQAISNEIDKRIGQSMFIKPIEKSKIIPSDASPGGANLRHKILKKIVLEKSKIINPFKDLVNINIPKDNICNNKYAKENGKFKALCEAFGVKPTARQVSKYRNKKGYLYMRSKKISNINGIPLVYSG